MLIVLHVQSLSLVRARWLPNLWMLKAELVDRFRNMKMLKQIIVEQAPDTTLALRCGSLWMGS
uniref:Uncharacterized protein n=1 Tax=Arundo donax TaxID=35708 RepID=A0A0A9DYC5_ARUDO